MNEAVEWQHPRAIIYAAIMHEPVCVAILYRFAPKMETEAAARSPTRKRVPGRTEQYVEESDADTH